MCYKYTGKIIICQMLILPKEMAPKSHFYPQTSLYFCMALARATASLIVTYSDNGSSFGLSISLPKL
jgi:hypothetical protein